MSRMYLGAHSLNQVIQGVFFGFAMVILYQFCGLK
jgi:membrane-associated phospholipid phosphatase